MLRAIGFRIPSWRTQIRLTVSKATRMNGSRNRKKFFCTAWMAARRGPLRHPPPQIPDMGSFLSQHLVGECEHLRRKDEVHRLGRLEIEDQH